ncbi:hypothetical protein LSCM1_00344 [Leishmania martiniquensis]|uniref:Uncharacterized protein n=1 Tax=Leishmania martiniquensis TaxID=1580590 RepID=A0A836K5U5_9TRYP|nr:hypothetical protein LSCM1_00344 [Leishmania martiniquensis]
MASYAELLQTCAEFQENFSALTGKYNALSLELKNAKALCERKQQQLDEAAAREERQHKQLLEVKRESENAAAFRERYRTATLTIEHLKAQIANAQQSALDVSLEHDQEKQQLKQQLEDMIRRVETASDGQRLREAQRQALELEERCAAINAQLLEDRERHNQQLLTAHNALREQQSHNLELEQRYRAMEADVAEMQAAVRRSTELQNEAALLKERYATAATVAQHQAEEFRADAEELRRRLAQLKEDHQAQADQLAEDAAKERDELQERLASLTADLATAQSTLAEERVLYRKMQASAEEQVMHVRNAAVVEASALRRTHATLKEENTRLQWRLEKMDGELRDGQEALQAMQARHDSLAAKLQQSQSQLDTAAQQEAWLACEKQNVVDQLAVARQQLEVLHKELMDHEEVKLQVQQLTMRLASAAEEAQSHRHAALVLESQLRDVEEASELKVRELRRELKAYKRQCAKEATRADRLRRKLVTALVEKEAELYRASRTADRVITLAEGEPVGITVGRPVSDDSTHGDVISMLRHQSQQAEDLHTRLVQLAR